MPEPTVAEAMSRHVITAGPDTGFTELIGLLTAHDLCAVPIVDATGRPQGVVTEADLLTACGRRPDLASVAQAAASLARRSLRAARSRRG
jgi:CBS-domain-containing membrane protein